MADLKRCLALLLMVLVLLAIPAHASGVNTWEVSAAVASSGEAQMTVKMVITLDSPTNKLVIPLGGGAKNLVVNGVECRVRSVKGVPSVVLESEAGFSGTLQFDLTYTLNRCLDAQDTWDLVLPLLGGSMEYTVEKTKFQVTLPQGCKAQPKFESGYMGGDVDNYMTYTAEENVITGTVDAAFRDHENFTLRMATDPAVFPRTGEAGKSRLWAAAAAAACIALAVIYWYFRLRWSPFRLKEQTNEPMGVNPGFIGCQLMGKKTDFALLLLTWAQAGYLTIYRNRDHSVTLFKRMDMGNERTPYENKIFSALFGKGTVAEVSSRSFQSLKGKVNRGRPKIHRLFDRGGRPFVLRTLGALSAGFGWMSMADVMMPAGPQLRYLLLVLFWFLGAVSGVMIQSCWQGLLSWNRKPGYVALGAAVFTIFVGLIAGSVLGAGIIVLSQMLLGLTVVFGGRRSQEGRDMVQAILSYRKYMRTISSKRINRMIGSDPGYYYTMAIYALALGVDKPLAKRFAPVELPECLWLVTDEPQEHHSDSWYRLLREVTKIIRSKSGYDTAPEK